MLALARLSALIQRKIHNHQKGHGRGGGVDRRQRADLPSMHRAAMGADTRILRASTGTALFDLYQEQRRHDALRGRTNAIGQSEELNMLDKPAAGGRASDQLK